MVIKDGTASYAAWKETPIPVYTKFYFFDMLNPQVSFVILTSFTLRFITRRSCSTDTRCPFLRSEALTLSERWKGR